MMMNSEQEQFQDGEEGFNEKGQHQSNKPSASRVDDDANTQEEGLPRGILSGNIGQPDLNKLVMEGKPMGGHKFGRESHPPTGDAPNNPSQNAGHSNAFLAITDPLEEYCQDNNFKVASQRGEPEYQQHNRATMPCDMGDKGTVEGPSIDATEHTYDQQGVGYGDNDPGSKGYRERVEQQKVGGG